MSDGNDLNTEILNKLEGLERRYRRLKTLVTGGLALAALAVTGAFALPEVSAQLAKSEVEAQLLIIRDAQGNQRVLIGVNDNGDAGVWVLNQAGQQAVVMSGTPGTVDQGTNGLWVLDGRGGQRLTMAAGSGYSGIWLSEGPEHQIRMRVSNGNPEHVFRNPGGQEIYRLP